MTGLIHFSPDAASNDFGAPPINFGEGQPANTVNNSAREMMAALARWHSDTTGELGATATGAGGYRISSNQGFKQSNLGRSFKIAFQVDSANAGPCTLDIDGSGNFPLLRPGSIALGPGDLFVGLLINAMWLPNIASYIITAPFFARPGAISAFGADGAVPPGWVPCDGRSLSRVSYAALFAFIGGTHGLPDGNTFRVPDLRGRAPFGADGGTNRLTGAGGLGGGLGNSGGAETVQLSEAQLAAHSHAGTAAAAGGHDHGGSTSASGGHDHGGSTGSGGSHAHSGTTSGGGGHGHSGSTDSAGTHTHGVGYLRQSNYRTDGASGGTNALNAGEGGTNTTGITDPNGAHSHGVTINPVGDHTHSFTTGSAGDHTHTIAGVGNHAHGIPSVADHAHALTISAAGSGQGHPNVPPGLVVAFAIKA